MTTPPTPSDEQLVLAARQGDTASFEQLVHRHFGLVHMIALSRVRQPDLAEDVAQEALVRAYLALDRLRQPAQFAAWLSQITRNLALDRLEQGARAERLLARIPIEDMAEVIPDERDRGGRETMQTDETNRALYAALEKLPEAQREVLLLHFGEDMSQQEIADRLGVHQVTISRQLKRGLQAMQKDLEPNLREDLRPLRAKREGAVKAAAAIVAIAALSPAAKAALTASAVASVPVASTLTGGTVVAGSGAISGKALIIVASLFALAVIGSTGLLMMNSPKQGTKAATPTVNLPFGQASRERVRPISTRLRYAMGEVAIVEIIPGMVRRLECNANSAGVSEFHVGVDDFHVDPPQMRVATWFGLNEHSESSAPVSGGALTVDVPRGQVHVVVNATWASAEGTCTVHFQADVETK